MMCLKNAESAASIASATSGITVKGNASDSSGREGGSTSTLGARTSAGSHEGRVGRGEDTTNSTDHPRMGEREAGRVRAASGNEGRIESGDVAVAWWTFAAISLGLAISWKIYPVIYIPAIWASMARRYGWFGGEVWWFGVVVLGTLVLVNWPLWSV